MFGINAAPFLAQFVSQYHAKKWEKSYPRAAETILHSTYMDDSMDSVESETESIKLYKSLSELWDKAAMHTHKWLSNSTTVLPSQDRLGQLELNESDSLSMKTLGVLWLANEDVLLIR